MHKLEQETHLENLLQQLQSYPGIQISFTTTAEKPELFEDWANHCVFGKMKVSQKVSKKLAPQMA